MMKSKNSVITIGSATSDSERFTSFVPSVTKKGRYVKTKLSYSAASMDLECGYKYKKHYIERVRPAKVRSALLFGGALDTALNTLLETKDVNKAKDVFRTNWTKSNINGEEEDLRTSDKILFSKADFEPVLGKDPWESMLHKGLLMIEAYYVKVLPKIKRVITVQKEIAIENTEGDKIKGFLDLIVEWEDGRILLMDNKSSKVPYEPDSAGKSRQLVLYYYLEKETFNLDAVGFIVLDKNINLNETKTCAECGADHTGRRVKSCDAKVNGKKCGNKINSFYKPEVNITFVINAVDEKYVDVTIDEFDTANDGISNNQFEQNKSACIGKFGKCPYYGLCHHGSMKDLLTVKESGR
jgi:hypothetical protein